jgi:hypothetical protein
MFAPPPTASPLTAMMSGLGKSQKAMVWRAITMSGGRMLGGWLVILRFS